MNTIIILVTIAYFVVMLLIGIWAHRRTKSTKEFLVAGQSIGFFVMAIATFSSIQSGWGMYGTTGTLYDWGIQGMFTTAILTPLGFLLAWALLGTRLRRMAQHHEVYSVPDIIRLRYGSKTAHITVSIAMFIGSVGYMTTQVAATGFIMSLIFGTSFITGAWIGAIIVASYTVAGGMLAAIWTDLIQGLLMIVMSIVVFIIATSNVGGWGSMLETLHAQDPALTTALGVMPLTYVFSSAIMITFGVAGQPQLITKFLMIRDEKELRWGALVAGVAYSVTTFFALGVGLAVRAMVIEGSLAPITNIDQVTIQFFNSPDIINPIVGGLALVALLGAIMSSASSFITIGASAITRDLAAALNIPIKRELFWGRFFSVVVVLFSLLFALYLDQIIFLMGAFGWAAFGVTTFGPIVLGIYWKRATGMAAASTMIIGLLFNLVFTILTAKEFITVPNYFFTGGVTLVLGILVFIIISYITNPRNDVEKFNNLYQQPKGGETFEN